MESWIQTSLNFLLKRVMTFDVETTTTNKGSPFTLRNKLVTIQIKNGNDTTRVFKPEEFHEVPAILRSASMLVATNSKFDLHWLQRELGFLAQSVWDCQLAEFLLSKQLWIYPDLATMCEKYGVDKKLDIVKLEYWERNCSCHVSVVTQILTYMQKEFVSLATIENIKELDLAEHLKNVYGEKLIQKSIQLLNKGDVKNYLLVWKHRLEHEDPLLKTNTECLTQTMIESWLKSHAQFVDLLHNSQLTTTIKQERLGIDCVSLVTQLWDILKSQHGWSEHKHTCKGTPIDTDEIPFDILAEYGARDVDATYQVFLKQVDILTSEKSSLFQLFRVQCNDLLCLQDMEYNGILYDAEASLTAAEELNEQIARIDAELQAKYGMGIPINFDSRDDISTLLYGGHIGVDSKIPIGVFKTGARTGETKYKNITTEYAFPRLVEPLKGSELKKEGFFSTDADTLVSLKPDKMTRQLINKLLERAKVKKLQSTYLTGFPKIIGVMEWENNILHSNLNQCSVVTGRLSSTKPNQQNLPKEAKRHCVTRY